MNNQNMSGLVDVIKKRRKEVQDIRLYDEEIANYFLSLLDRAENELIYLDDEKEHMTPTDLEVVKFIANVEIAIDKYNRNGNTLDISTAMQPKGATISGTEKKKQYVIDRYRGLAQIVSQMETIDIKKIKDLKEKWESEKGTVKYSEAESYAIERLLANCFIDYQIRFIKANGKMPLEKINEFCDVEQYEYELRSRIIDSLLELPKDSEQRLELENELSNSSFEDILTNVRLWGLLSNKTLQEPVKAVDVVSKEKIEEAPKPEPKKEQPLVPLDPNEKMPGGGVLLVYLKTKRDGSTVLKKKVKQLDSQGRFRTFFNKDKVVEIYFLEGTEKLSYTDQGSTSSKITSLSDFPNLMNVYLPGSLRTIEQGYFFGCENLQNIFLGEGTCYNPNRDLIPEQVQIVQNENTPSKGRIVISQPAEKSVIFNSRGFDNSGKSVSKPIKVKLTLGGEPYANINIPNPDTVTDVYYTDGTDTIGTPGAEMQDDKDHPIKVSPGSFHYGWLPNLETVHCPTSLRRIMAATFYDCKKLKNINLPSNLEEIRCGSFGKCISLKSIDIPDSVKYIGPRAFEGCSSLKEIDLPLDLESVGEHAFENCSSLERVSFPPWVKKIDYNAFALCNNLRDLKLPEEGITEVLSGFYGCTSLKTVILPKQVDQLDFNAFRSCDNLEYLVIPEKLNYYKFFNQAVDECTSLKAVFVPHGDHKMKEFMAARVPGQEGRKLFGRKVADVIELPENKDNKPIKEFVEEQIRMYEESQNKEQKPDSTSTPPTKSEENNIEEVEER